VSQPNDAVAVDRGGSDFIRQMIRADRLAGCYDGRVQTRFPPEPNGYPHIGHAKSICLNFGVAEQFGGQCNLRFDDTNPSTEEIEFVEAIQRDVRWLGFEWQEPCRYASDYFERIYQYAEQLVSAGKAYVDSLPEEKIREFRGTVTEVGRPSPYRLRSVEENLNLLRRMRAGEFADGEHVLRAKADMAAANMKMRDPLLYRIRRAHHYRTAEKWAIYPMYDFAHCLSDAIEGITHSLCTLEFENNREIYDWVLEHVLAGQELEQRPRQTEFARLSLSYTVLSKRKLLELVAAGQVEGWSDPRMPTLSGLRRRGYTASAIRAFCERIGVGKANSTIDVAVLEHSIRDDLNTEAPRVLAVLQPLEVVIDNYPEDGVEEIEAPYFPRDVAREGSRKLPFSRRIFIERDDFMEDPPKKFFRLAPGREVRLRHAWVIRCTGVEKDPESGAVTRLHCTYDPDTLEGPPKDGRRIQGTLHWVSAEHAVPIEARLYDRLFNDPQPDRGKGGADFKSFLNHASLRVLAGWAEPSLASAAPGSRFQFERQGYFYLEPEASSAAGRAVFNRIVTLRDTWSKQAAEQAPAAKPSAESQSASASRKRRRNRSPADPTAGWSARRLAELERHQDELGLSRQEALVIVAEPTLMAFFAAAVASHAAPKAIAGWIVNELPLKTKPVAELPFAAPELAELVALVDAGTITGKIAKEVLAVMLEEGGSPRRIVAERDLSPLGDAAELEPVIAGILASHPTQVEQFHSGKVALLGFFVGQVMKETRGRANPGVVQRLLREALS